MDSPFLSTSRGMGARKYRAWNVKESGDALHLRMYMPGLASRGCFGEVLLEFFPFWVLRNLMN